MADFFEVVRSQRACRSFAPDPVPDEVVQKVLEAATFAPSAENSQPWVFVVVRDEDHRRLLVDLTRRAWEGGARTHAAPRLSPGLLDDVDEGVGGGFLAAPVLVVVGGDTSRCHRRVLEASVFPAVQNLLLAATALGLGTAFTTLSLAFSEEVAAALAIPEEIVPMAVVPMGRPNRALGRPRRQGIATKAHRERYGTGW